jgi:lysozyme
MVRHVIDSVRAKLEQFEGLRLTAYKDSVGVLTIGYGHTGKDVVPGLTITQADADQLLASDLVEAENAVSRLVKVPLSDNQFGALVSFTFNVGTSAFAGSSLLKKLNAGDYEAEPAELAKWNKGTVNGKKVVLPGLTNRRAAEAGIWATGAHVSSNYVPAAPAPVGSLLSKPETIAGGVSVATAVLGAANNGGPVAWAVAAVIVVAVAIGAFVFVKRIRENAA